jgi:hypothetical protein
MILIGVQRCTGDTRSRTRRTQTLHGQWNAAHLLKLTYE